MIVHVSTFANDFIMKMTVILKMSVLCENQEADFSQISETSSSLFQPSLALFIRLLLPLPLQKTSALPVA